MSRWLMAVALIGAAGWSPAAAQGQADRDGVRRAVLDYVEGFYEGDSTKFLRGVRPEFFKYGFFPARDGGGYKGERMSWDDALAYIRNVKERKRFAPADAPKGIDVYDVNDQTASAKLTAFWGIDYLLLAKYDGRWMISHVLWQTPPKK
ncbi:MAG: nuclear transport factor 2 family protein [Gemmatimonadales bacterium]